MPVDPAVEPQPDASNAALARKRRKVIRAKYRDADNESVVPDSVSSEDDDDHLLGEPSLRGIKKQARYHPGVPMSRDQLKAWRKEARRVRNRESAAASRKRTRERIDELEAQVENLQSRYSAALQRIVELEAAAAVHDTVAVAAVTPHPQEVSDSVPQDGNLPPSIVSPVLSPTAPSVSPRSSFTLVSEEEDQGHQQKVESKYQHIIEMISRPTA